MNNQICRVKISIGFGEIKPRVWKKGEGKNIQEAIKDLFNRQHNYIKAFHMSAVMKDLYKAKTRLIKEKE